MLFIIRYPSKQNLNKPYNLGAYKQKHKYSHEYFVKIKNTHPVQSDRMGEDGEKKAIEEDHAEKAGYIGKGGEPLGVRVLQGLNGSVNERQIRR